MDGGRLRRPHLLGIYFMSKMHTKTIQKIQKAYIKTYEKDVKIYKDIENSQGTLLLRKCCGWRGPKGVPVFSTKKKPPAPGSFLYLYIFLHLLHMFLYMLFVFFV